MLDQRPAIESSHGTGSDDAVGVDEGREAVTVGVFQHARHATGKRYSPQFVKALFHCPEAREGDCGTGR